MTMPDELSAPAPTDYSVTHCRRCAAGWTRTGKEGGVVTVCLLDRERVMTGMTHCDRFEQREDRPAAA